jgi:HEAT repeat protein
MPHLVYGQHVEYMFQMRSMQGWEKAWKEGALIGPQRFFWEKKPAEELYDLKTDPHEVKNLIGSSEHRETLTRMRSALRQHMLDVRDNGFIPEGSPLQGYSTSHDAKDYPMEAIMEVADTAIRQKTEDLGRLAGWLADRNECVRYWAALGCVMLGEKAAPAAGALEGRLADDSGSVRVAAAEALCRIGRTAAGLASLQDCLLKGRSPWVRLQAANALQNLGLRAKPALAAIQKAATDENDYVQRAAKYTAAVLE